MESLFMGRRAVIRNLSDQGCLHMVVDHMVVDHMVVDHMVFYHKGVFCTIVF
jgi:hypothetical protein